MRSLFKRCFEAICYICGVDYVFYLLNKNAKRVVTFHNVLPDQVCECMTSLPVAIRASEFRNAVRELKRFFQIDTDLSRPGTLTITFDDGYLNQYEVAAKVMREEGVDAGVLFASAGALASKSLTEALAIDQDLHKGVDMTKEYERLRLTGIPLRRLEELRERGWKVGYHTVSHRVLSELSAEELRSELCPPAWLKDKIISYPFGGWRDVGDSVTKVAQEYGYCCAYSNKCEPGLPYSRWFLPRMAVSVNRYSLHFELSGVKYFLKSGRLLPCLP